MNVRFLGTSFGAPSMGRHQQSVLVETDGATYLIDAGAPVLDILVNSNYDMSKIKAVFLTHLHGDHLNGLFDIINLADYYNIRLTVFLPERSGIDLFETYLATVKNRYTNTRISFQLIGAPDFYDDGNLKAKSFPTAHMESAGRPSYGFLLDDGRSRVYITGDLHETLKDLPPFLHSESVDMIVSECAHPTAERLFEELDRCKAALAAIVHVMPAEKYADLEECAKHSNMRVVFPRDNDVYSI